MYSSKELFDFGILMGRAALVQTPMPAGHCDVPGDWHEREFVKAMLEDGLLRQAEDELDRKENQP